MVHDRLNPTLARYSQHWPSVLFQACERSSEWSQVLMLCGFTNSLWMFMAKYGKLKACGFTCLFFLLGFKMCLFSRHLQESHIRKDLLIPSPTVGHWFAADSLGGTTALFSMFLSKLSRGAVFSKSFIIPRDIEVIWLTVEQYVFQNKVPLPLWSFAELYRLQDKTFWLGFWGGVWAKDLDSHFSKKIQPEINQQRLFFTSDPVAMQIPYIKNG